jgi:hypothetical protein
MQFADARPRSARAWTWALAVNALYAIAFGIPAAVVTAAGFLACACICIPVGRAQEGGFFRFFGTAVVLVAGLLAIGSAILLFLPVFLPLGAVAVVVIALAAIVKRVVGLLALGWRRLVRARGAGPAAAAAATSSSGGAGAGGGGGGGGGEGGRLTARRSPTEAGSAGGGGMSGGGGAVAFALEGGGAADSEVGAARAVGAIRAPSPRPPSPPREDTSSPSLTLRRALSAARASATATASALTASLPQRAFGRTASASSSASRDELPSVWEGAGDPLPLGEHGAEGKGTPHTAAPVEVARAVAAGGGWASGAQAHAESAGALPGVSGDSAMALLHGSDSEGEAARGSPARTPADGGSARESALASDAVTLVIAAAGEEMA